MAQNRFLQQLASQQNIQASALEIAHLQAGMTASVGAINATSTLSNPTSTIPSSTQDVQNPAPTLAASVIGFQAPIPSVASTLAVPTSVATLANASSINAPTPPQQTVHQMNGGTCEKPTGKSPQSPKNKTANVEESCLVIADEDDNPVVD